MVLRHLGTGVGNQILQVCTLMCMHTVIGLPDISERIIKRTIFKTLYNLSGENNQVELLTKILLNQIIPCVMSLMCNLYTNTIVL